MIEMGPLPNDGPRRPPGKEWGLLSCGRHGPQLMRDSLGSRIISTHDLA